MINDKKIEKAAKYYAEENSMSVEDQMGDTYDGIEELSDAYKAGAKWAINEFLKDLRHPAKEIPEEERPVLVVYKHGGYSIEYWRAYNFSGQINYWTLDITQWLYVDELFPKEGGEQ